MQKKKCRSCVSALVRQCLHIIFCHLRLFSHFSTQGNQNASTSDLKLTEASAVSQTLSLSSQLLMLSTAKRVMGVHGLMATVVPISYRKNYTCCIKDLYLKLTYIHNDTETHFSPRYSKIDDTVTSLLC